MLPSCWSSLAGVLPLYIFFPQDLKLFKISSCQDTPLILLVKCHWKPKVVHRTCPDPNNETSMEAFLLSRIKPHQMGNVRSFMPNTHLFPPLVIFSGVYWPFVSVPNPLSFIPWRAFNKSRSDWPRTEGVNELLSTKDVTQCCLRNVSAHSAS